MTSQRRMWVGAGLGLALVIASGGLWWVYRSRDPFAAQAIKQAPFPSLTYSIQTFLWWDEGQQGLHLDWVRLMSFSHIKQTFAWKDVERQAGQWHWAEPDKLLAEAEKRGLKVIARLGGTPAWATSARGPMTDAPPDDLALWANYCDQVSARYRGRITAYQIWNEPNLSREWGNRKPNAAQYVDLLAACSRAIRANDPNAILISAGLAPTGNYDALAHRDDIYLNAMYTANFQQYIDVVGVHAPGFSPPSYGPDDAEADGIGRWFTFRRIEDLRKIMIAHGDAARQMAVLEFGWTTDPIHQDYQWYAVSEEQQAQYLLDAYDYAIAHWRPWVGLMSVIYMPDVTWNADDEEYWWAITTPDKGHRPAFFALANMRKVCDNTLIPARAPDSPEALGLVPTTLCP